MKKRIIYLLFIILFCCKAFAQTNASYLIEAESFQFKGGWFVAKDGNCMGNSMLRVLGGKNAAPDALTVIDVKSKGNYTVWVRSADFQKDRQGTRLFRLFVDEQQMEEAGKHGIEGFAWEKVGTVGLEPKKVLLRLKDTRKNNGRCDAILLTLDTTLNPNEKQLAGLAKYRVKPIEVPVTSGEAAPVTPPFMISSNAETVAEISNDKIKLRFLRSSVGNKRIAAKTDIKANGDWVNMNPFYEDHKVYLLSSQEPAITFGSFYPSWNGSKVVGYFMHDGKKMEMQEPDDLMNPFVSGNLSEAIPVEAKKTNSNSIEVKYRTSDGATITGTWSIAKNSGHISVKLQCKAVRAGFYSMGIAAFQSVAVDKVTNVQLPPMFQYKRLSPQPVMLVSAMMQQPVAIAETKLGNGLISTFISGDTSSFPLEWGSSYTSPMGFAIKNEANKVQPVAFSPVLGLDDSKLAAGQTIERSFVIGAVAAGWNEALEYISENVYKVKDYRTQKQASLTDAVFNMVDLIKNDEAAGWSKESKGFYDIEANPKTAATVVQCSPLTIVSTAVITKDEDFYIKRALPTIEYTLSRSGFRWAKGIVPSSFNNTNKTLLLSPYNSQFTTSYYEGLYHLLGEANPWIKNIALPDDKIRYANGYSVNVPTWIPELAAYKLTKNSKWLMLAKADADKFIAEQVYSNTAKPLTSQPFYNTSFYAYWWNLVDFYELTKEDKYLKAAETSAFQTIVGIRSTPQVEDLLQTIHPNNKFDGTATLWWKGDKHYRLGFPRVDGDVVEKQVPQSLVSAVGLGFEQPSTYFDGGAKAVHPVFMSSWAPHLLRLFQYTKRPIFNTYARNAVIGRFTNYPGYYASGFTDIDMQPDFPYKGPDVSSIYYHHIPAHLAFSWDYLVSEAIQRSNGKMNFPYGIQDGFVWFTNRLYGADKGVLYDDKQAKLWMKKNLVTLNTPEVNYITAISNDRFWVVLLSESDKNLPVTINLSKETGVAANAVASMYSNAKTKSVAINTKNNELAVTLDAKGFAALSFPLSKNKIEQTTPIVKDGMKVIDMGEPWGKVYLFRIRSPFGWDSIYGFAETPPIDGAVATITCSGETVTKNSYPFEWSFYKLNTNDKAKVKIILTTSDGKTKEEALVMEGN